MKFNFVFRIFLISSLIFSNNIFADEIKTEIKIDNSEQKEHNNIEKKEEIKKPIDLNQLTINDIYLGNKNAKLTMVEYTSLTCPHCLNFHKQSFDQIKKKYIDSNKILYIIRDFPTDPISFKGSLALRCIDNMEQKIQLRSMLLKNQEPIIKKVLANKSPDNKVKIKEAEDMIGNIFEMAGFERSKIENCMNAESEIGKVNKEILFDQINNFSDRFGKNVGAPSFIINDIKYEGAKSYAEWERILDEELAKLN